MSIQTSSPRSPAQVSSSRRDQKAPAFMIPFMKMPLILYRLGLGRLLGRRFMCLTHVGRKSGRVYRTVLAVLSFDETTRTVFAVSPWRESNWYRNIQASPAIEVETGDIRHGRIRFTPVQRSLTPEEIAGAFAGFCRRYPIFSRMVARIPGWDVNASDEELLELARTLRGVAFSPRE